MVRAGRATIVVVIVLVPALLTGRRDTSSEYFQLAAVAVLAGLGFVSWLVTRWRIDGDDLRIETGVLRRQSLRFPLSQVQAIDIVRPGLARMCRVGELRLPMGRATSGTARLACRNGQDSEPRRAQLL